MRAVKIAVSLIVLQASVALALIYAGFEAHYDFSVYSSLAHKEYSFPLDVFAWIILPVLVFIDIVRVLLTALFAAGYFYAWFIPIPPWFQALTTLLFDLMYIWAFVQFITQRSGKLYD